jgi:hypothetical protein
MLGRNEVKEENADKIKHTQPRSIQISINLIFSFVQSAGNFLAYGDAVFSVQTLL